MPLFHVVEDVEPPKTAAARHAIVKKVHRGNRAPSTIRKPLEERTLEVDRVHTLAVEEARHAEDAPVPQPEEVWPLGAAFSRPLEETARRDDAATFAQGTSVGGFGGDGLAPSVAATPS